MKIFEVVSTLRKPSVDSIKRALLSPRVLGMGVLKSLPVVANILSAVLAARDLIRGDWVGVGINLVGIFGGNVTQISTFAYQFARDQYAEQYYGEDAPPMIFEKDMASNPDLTTQRLDHLKELTVSALHDLVNDTQGQAKQSAQRKKGEFTSTAGGAAIGYPNIK